MKENLAPARDLDAFIEAGCSERVFLSKAFGLGSVLSVDDDEPAASVGPDNSDTPEIPDTDTPEIRRGQEALARIRKGQTWTDGLRLAPSSTAASAPS